MKLNERSAAHMVSGHVDGVGGDSEPASGRQCTILEIEAPKEILRLCVPRGSITVDGISLTIQRGD